MTTIDKSDNNYVYYLVGKNIRKYRKLKSLKQRELAEKCSLSEGLLVILKVILFVLFHLIPFI